MAIQTRIADSTRTIAENLAAIPAPRSPGDAFTLVVAVPIVLSRYPGDAVVAPGHVQLAIPRGGLVRLASGSLAVSAPIDAGDWRIFGDVTGAANVVLGHRVARGAWWGLAVSGRGVQAAGSAIRLAGRLSAQIARRSDELIPRVLPPGSTVAESYRTLLHERSGGPTRVSDAIRFADRPYSELDAGTRDLLWARIQDLEAGTTSGWDRLKHAPTVALGGDARAYLTGAELKELWAMRVAMALYNEVHGLCASKLTSMAPENAALLLSFRATEYTTDRRSRDPSRWVLPPHGIPPHGLVSFPPNDPESAATCRNGQGFYVWNDAGDELRPVKNHLGSVWDVNPLDPFRLVQEVLRDARGGRWYYAPFLPAAPIVEMELAWLHLEIRLGFTHYVDAVDRDQMPRFAWYPNGHEGEPNAGSFMPGLDFASLLGGYRTPERNVRRVLSGCGGAAGFLQAVARALNIPSVVINLDPNPFAGESGHAGLLFPSLGKVCFSCDEFFSTLATAMPLRHRLFDESIIAAALSGYDHPVALYLAERDRFVQLFGHDIPLLVQRLRQYPVDSSEMDFYRRLENLFCRGGTAGSGFESVETLLRSHLPLSVSACPEFSVPGCSPGGHLSCDAEVLPDLNRARQVFGCGVVGRAARA